MAYVDGFVAAVPTANKQIYKDFAEKAAVYFKKHGAIHVVEGWGDDVPEGEINSFHTAVLKKPDETVVFSWITWPDKATRDAGMTACIAEMEADGVGGDMPLDGKRMIFGGFDMIVEA